MDILLGFCLGVIFTSIAAVLLLRKRDQNYAMLQQERDGLESELSVEKQLHEERKRLYDSLDKNLSQSFKSISSDVLGEGNRNFMQLAEAVFTKFEERAVQKFDSKESAIDRLIEPISQSLKTFSQQVQDIEKQRLSAYEGVKEQIGALKSAHYDLMSETKGLAGALKSPTARGRWGEVQLKRVIELAGMVQYCDFVEQPSLSQEKTRIRPDVVVQLPGEKYLAIDAKVPLQAYLDAVNESDDDKRRELMVKHASQVKRQVTDLAKKSYWASFEDSPDLVVLFLPGESFFSAALEADPSLIEVGAESRVVIATPTTLIALLKTVAHAWREESLTENSKHIARLGKELHQRICDFSFHMADVGKHLGGSVNSYNKAIGTLESRLLVTARKFKNLGVDEGKKEMADQIPLDVDVRSVRSFDL